MMIKRLKNILGKGLLAGSLMLGGGCATGTVNEADLLRVVLGLGSINRNNDLNRDQRRALGLLGNAAREQGNRQHEREVAEIGRTQINIDNYGNRTEQSVRNAFGNVKIWKIDHDVYENEKIGMKIHTKLRIANNKGWPTNLAAYFYHKNGSKLWDKDRLYKADDGQVSVGSEKLIPPYVDTTYDDATMFMPYNQFDIFERGKHNLKFNVVLWDYSEGTPRQLDTSNWKHIRYNNQ